jgi:hypothetical protein
VGGRSPHATLTRRAAPSLCQQVEFTSDSQARLPVGSRLHPDAYWYSRRWEAWRLDRRRWWRDLAILPGDFCRQKNGKGGDK